uniref:AXH domain-containing protein n=1 Tax=Eptatretus burgeri TaxID=7764 RepID=A0A8C4QQ77_EPTBU
MLVAMVSAEVPGEKARSSYVREIVSPSDRRHENNPAASCSTGVLQPSHSLFLSSNTAFQATSSSVTSQNHHRQQLQQQVPATFSQTTPPAVTTPPAHFYRGSVIQMAGGELKRVEELVTEDFVRSAEVSKELKLDSSTVTATGPGSAPGLALLRFAIGETRTPASIQVLAEHPFFVFGRGWASCLPEQTSQQIGLPCTKLAVGDVCISLALRSSHTTLLSSATAIHSGQDASPSGRLWEPASSTSFYQGLGTALIQPSFESHNHPQSHSQSKSTTATSSRESISSVSLSVATHNDRHQHHCEDPESHYTDLHHQHHLCRSQIVPQRKDTPGSCRLEMRSGSGGGICGSQAADAARTQIAHRDLVPHIVHKTVVTAMKKPSISRTMDLSPARRERPGSEVDLGSGQRWHPETRDGRFEVAGSQPVRKRRWSAPECGEHRVLRSSDSMQNRPMFISREVKVSIEGHSSTGR